MSNQQVAATQGSVGFHAQQQAQLSASPYALQNPAFHGFPIQHLRQLQQQQYTPLQIQAILQQHQVLYFFFVPRFFFFFFNSLRWLIVDSSPPLRIPEIIIELN